MFDTFQRAEYRFVKRVILRTKRERWTEEDLRYISKEYKRFINKTKLDELDMLRKGEVMLGEYCTVDMTDIDDVKDLICKCVYSIDEISVPICIVIIGALIKLALSEIDGKEDFNELKEER